jgi:preprotein translocase subunit SecE
MTPTNKQDLYSSIVVIVVVIIALIFVLFDEGVFG